MQLLVDSYFVIKFKRVEMWRMMSCFCRLVDSFWNISHFSYHESITADAKLPTFLLIYACCCYSILTSTSTILWLLNLTFGWVIRMDENVFNSIIKRLLNWKCSLWSWMHDIDIPHEVIYVTISWFRFQQYPPSYFRAGVGSWYNIWSSVYVPNFSCVSAVGHYAWPKNVN